MKKKVHLATLMDNCHLKNAELEPKFKNTKGRVVLRPRILSGIHRTRIFCFSHEGRECNGCHCKATFLCKTSSRRSISLHPSEDLICGYVFHDTNDPNHGHILKIQWFLSNEICTDIHLLASCGKDNLKKICWDLDGKKFRIVKFSVFIDKKDYSCRYTWMTSKWMERNRIWLPCRRN